MENFIFCAVESLIAQRHVHDHMRSYDLRTHDLNITRELLDSISSTKNVIFRARKIDR